MHQGWQFLCRELDEFIEGLPPQQRLGEHWYRGTADAVYQNIYTIEQTNSEHLLILSGDHIYKMDYSELIQDHIHANADCTIGCLPVSLEEGRSFGVMGVDTEQWVQRFEEKPKEPFPIPGQSETCLASMGIYVFKTSFLLNALCNDGARSESSHDFGKDLLPAMIQNHRVRAFPFKDRNTGDSAYWRDVGTLDSYYAANMDLVAVKPQLNMYDTSWPIRGYHPPLPPPKFVFADNDSDHQRLGHALDSIVCPGSILSGGEVRNSILSANVRINSWSKVSDSILFENVVVGRNSEIHKAIVDKNVVIPPETRIGFDAKADRERGLHVTESGLTVVPKGHLF
ncbi:UNVERIFIED_CONTAM: hypothetical protein GTU68_061927 [Idotea baltica]|nr:hypothetical protein [Idotea baltica]